MSVIQKSKGAHIVDIVESERGWGSKVDETIYFDIEVEAKKYVEDYNAKYNPPLKPGEMAPDWYMIAVYRGKIA